MPIVSGDLTTGALTRSSDGWRHSVEYLVRAPSAYQAYQDVGVAHGTAHPSIVGIFALDFDVRPQQDQPRQWRVTVTYRRPEATTLDLPQAEPIGGVIQTGARVAPRTFSRDIAGSQIVTTHTFTDPDRAGLVTQPAEVDGFLATPVHTVTRTELESPAALARAFVGKVNASSFLGEPAETWLCTAIEGVSEDQGVSYQVTYEFEYRPDGWRAEVVFIDERTNRPVQGLTQGVELRTYQIYQLANFGSLNL